MSVLLHRRRPQLLALLPFVAGGALLLLLAALVASRLITTTEYRYLKVRSGEGRILEPKYPVRRVESTRPEVVATEIDPKQGLVVRAHRRGLSEVTYERADGKRFHWFVQVRGKDPIRVSIARPHRRTTIARRSRSSTAEREVVREIVRKKETEPVLEAKPKGQVVEIDKPAVEEKPDEAKYLSEYDSKVREETRARHRSPKRRPGAVVPPSPAVRAEKGRAPAQPAQPKPPAAAGGGGAPKQATPRESEGQGSALPKIAMGPAGVPGPGQGGEPGRGLLRPIEPGGEGSGQGPGKIDITPRPEVIAEALGAGAPDHLKGIKEGAHTFLNTKSWKGASFFNRLKRAVAQHWNPGEVYRRRDPYGNIYGIKDRYTLVDVILNLDGSLKNLRVINPSGIDFLDEEAVSALEAASPFPNPPAEIRDNDGLIRFAFGFYFEISDRPLFRIYRYND